MNVHTDYSGSRRALRTRSRGFTLIELLTVIAIISLLISILVPSVSKARDAAKNAKTRAIMKNMGDGLELFVNENAAELRGQNYPPSRAGDDPTDEATYTALATADMSGAQWVVRYLMGKKLDGYVSRRVVPPAILDQKEDGWEQKNWYGALGDTDWPPTLTDPLPRGGPYLEPGAVKLKAPKDIVGYKAANGTGLRVENPVIVDSFEMPILYYAADSLVAAKSNASIARYKFDPADPNSASATPGIYTYSDNALFTGLCSGGASGGCDVPRWDFGNGIHKLDYGPDSTWTNDVATLPANIANYPYSFPYYIMNKDAYESSGKKAVVPSRKDSYILISPGKDGLFGTGDDVTNFQ
jgi:prepilin-type N-terminal cleavage/methylation domain-containing protein